MVLTPLDWVIIVVYMLGCMVAGIWMRRYVRDVDDFAVAGREMDLNLGVASLAATEVGIVTVMYGAQAGFENGFAGAVPGILGCIAMLIIGWTGFVIGPLRTAGVMTIPELFEKRFGKLVRWLAGLVVVLGGLLNMGMFLRLGGQFLTYVVGVDANSQVLLPVIGVKVGMLELTMTSLLLIILVYTALGGMLSVLVTDYLQFLVMGLGIVLTSVLVIYHTGWGNLVTGLDRAYQEQTQLIDTSKVIEAKAAQARGEPAKPEDLTPKVLTLKDPFNPIESWGPGWVIWQTALQIAIMTTWQTTITRVLAARDAPTAKKIYVRTAFYFVGRFGLPGLWGAAAFLYFVSHGGLPDGIDSLTALPVYLGKIMPMGLIGLLIAAMLAAEMSTDSGYLLTWATVIFNDLIQPCLKRPMSAKTKLFTVRMLVLAIGVFLVFYGLWYPLKGKVWDYMSLTGSIYMASMFTLLVGALYWRLANRWGAIAAIVLGAVGPLGYLIVKLDSINPSWAKGINAEHAGMAAFVLAIVGMVAGSLLGHVAGVSSNEKRG